MSSSEETDNALQVLETPSIYHLHPHHQQRIVELANQVVRHKLQRGEKITCPENSGELIKTLLQERTEECMSVLFMDTKHQVIAFEELFH